MNKKAIEANDAYRFVDSETNGYSNKWISGQKSTLLFLYHMLQSYKSLSMKIKNWFVVLCYIMCQLCFPLVNFCKDIEKTKHGIKYEYITHAQSLWFHPQGQWSMWGHQSKHKALRQPLTLPQWNWKKTKLVYCLEIISWRTYKVHIFRPCVYHKGLNTYDQETSPSLMW